MSQNQLKEKVLNIISDHKIGVLSSVEDNKTTFTLYDIFQRRINIYTPTNKCIHRKNR
ncbi:hypothetical protein [Peribacillus sp. NPDC096540]|uniref:hypothetical protein n=1 Tax=Peribacillus sp. NPDC096540 TaxID=3390612 RepID=UPI003CFF86B2